MQNSTISLPNRSHSVMEIPTTNGDDHYRRSALIHSTSATNTPLLYQRSLTHLKGINDYDPEPVANGDDLFRTDKYNTVNNYFFNSFFLKKSS
jgi:hypothetical protein